jgi:hypothetical protein
MHRSSFAFFTFYKNIFFPENFAFRQLSSLEWNKKHNHKIRVTLKRPVWEYALVEARQNTLHT